MSNYSGRRKERERDYRGERDRDFRNQNSYSSSHRKTHQNQQQQQQYNENQQEELTEELFKPTKTIMIKGLYPQTTEDIILDYLKPFGRVESLKLVVDKVTSISKGIAYIEYPTIEDAEYFMLKNYRNGGFYLEVEGYYVELEYSIGGLNEAKASVYRDWRCPACNGTNFARRTVCYQCQTPKPENPESCIISIDDSKDVSEELPCPVLSIRGLSGQTSKQTLVDIFQSFATLKDVRVVWDKFKNESKGFGFIEYYSTEDATYALSQCSGMVIDEHYVKISYCKSGGLKKGSQAPAVMNPYEQWGQYPMVNTTPIANTAQAQANAFLASFKEPANRPSLGIPNEEEYSFDPTTGYYFNTNNQLYYDANTGYFYDAFKQQYCYYNAETKTFMPYSTPTADDQTTSATEAQVASQEKKKKKLTTTNLIGAKKVSNEMAKWNAKSKELKEDIKSTKIKTTSKPTIIIKKPISEISVQPIETKQEEVHQITSSNTITPPNNNESILETKVEKEETKTIPVSFNFNATSQASAYSAHVPTSTPIQTVTEEESVCFLCKRKFPSNEALLKHKQLSELHKHNLELAKVKEELKQKEKKNDQERRNRELQDIADSLKQYSSSIVEPNRSDLNSNNVGSKMLKKMGWQEGGGLGKARTGITAPIQVEVRTERAGLGSETNSYDRDIDVKPTDNYRDVAKKKARARFAAMMENSQDQKRVKRE